MTPSFRPAWWCRGPHAQTLWGALLRPTPQVPLRRERWETPDGDFLDIDRVEGASRAPVLVVLHGLEGSSRSKPVLGLMAAAYRAGWEAVGINFRSCSGESNRLRRAYHGGDSTELGWVLDRVIAQHPARSVGCVGVSLGGNVVLKYLGERGARVPPHVRAAGAISTPFDLGVAVRYMERAASRLYMRNLVRSLKQKTLAKLARYPDLVDPARLRAVRTLAEFDHLVTGPIHGFPDGQAYWDSSSSASHLGAIRRPALLINAEDDPFFPAGALPTRAVSGNPALRAEFVPGGGHAGFLAGVWPGRPVPWAEHRTMAFLQRHLTPAT
ncbi:MAG: alpha/beta fold hydrolase [Candidatus Omnitrophica bacterium]|nr:alpha/beta fold hydrolase [Candidatus Omnitrophota bacterium]